MERWKSVAKAFAVKLFSIRNGKGVRVCNYGDMADIMEHRCGIPRREAMKMLREIKP